MSLFVFHYNLADPTAVVVVAVHHLQGYRNLILAREENRTFYIVLLLFVIRSSI